MKKFKITIEDLETNEKHESEGSIVVVYVGSKDKDDINRATECQTIGKYEDICRAITLLSSQTICLFNNKIKQIIEEEK